MGDGERGDQAAGGERGSWGGGDTSRHQRTKNWMSRENRTLLICGQGCLPELPPPPPHTHTPLTTKGVYHPYCYHTFPSTTHPLSPPSIPQVVSPITDIDPKRHVCAQASDTKQDGVHRAGGSGGMEGRGLGIDTQTLALLSSFQLGVEVREICV